MDGGRLGGRGRDLAPGERRMRGGTEPTLRGIEPSAQAASLDGSYRSTASLTAASSIVASG
jgi:hypothetical protein